MTVVDMVALATVLFITDVFKRDLLLPGTASFWWVPLTVLSPCKALMLLTASLEDRLISRVEDLLIESLEKFLIEPVTELVTTSFKMVLKASLEEFLEGSLEDVLTESSLTESVEDLLTEYLEDFESSCFDSFTLKPCECGKFAFTGADEDLTKSAFSGQRAVLA